MIRPIEKGVYSILVLFVLQSAIRCLLCVVAIPFVKREKIERDAMEAKRMKNEPNRLFFCLVVGFLFQFATAQSRFSANLICLDI